MADSLGEAILDLRADDSGLKESIASAESGAKGLGPVFDSSTLSVGKMAAGFVAAVGAVQLFTSAWSGIKQFLGDSITAAAEQEAKIKALDAALRASGQYTPQYSAQLQQMAGAFQNLSTYEDDAIMGAQQLLISFGATPAQIQPATQAVMDLASGLGIDLNSAAMLVSKALDGNAGALGRYGIEVDKGATKSEQFAQIIEGVSEKFGGQAAAAADSYSGRITQIGNAWGDVKEEVGAALTQNEFVTESLEFVQESLAGVITWLQANKAEFTAFVGTTLKSAALGFLDFAAVGFSVGGAIETVGSKLGAMGAIAAGLASGDLAFAKVGLDALFADVPTYSEAALGKLAELRASVEGFGASTKPAVDTVGDDLSAASQAFIATAAAADQAEVSASASFAKVGESIGAVEAKATATKLPVTVESAEAEKKIADTGMAFSDMAKMFNATNTVQIDADEASRRLVSFKETGEQTIAAISDKPAVVKAETADATKSIADLGKSLADISDRKVIVSADVSPAMELIESLPDPIAVRTLLVQAQVSGSPTLSFSNYWQSYAPSVMNDFIGKYSGVHLDIFTSMQSVLAEGARVTVESAQPALQAAEQLLGQLRQIQAFNNQPGVIDIFGEPVTGSKHSNATQINGLIAITEEMKRGITQNVRQAEIAETEDARRHGASMAVWSRIESRLSDLDGSIDGLAGETRRFYQGVASGAYIPQSEDNRQHYIRATSG